MAISTSGNDPGRHPQTPTPEPTQSHQESGDPGGSETAETGVDPVSSIGGHGLVSSSQSTSSGVTETLAVDTPDLSSSLLPISSSTSSELTPSASSTPITSPCTSVSPANKSDTDLLLSPFEQVAVAGQIGVAIHARIATTNDNNSAANGPISQALTLCKVDYAQARSGSDVDGSREITRDPFRRFPSEISLNILSRFSEKERITLSNVCKSWRNLCRDGWLYKEINIDGRDRIPGSLILRQIEDAGKFLTKLRLRGCRHLACHWLDKPRLAEAGGRMKLFSVQHSELSELHAAFFIASNPQLEEIELPAQFGIGTALVNAICRCKRLHTLDLSSCIAKPGQSLARIAMCCQNLKVLNLRSADLLPSFQSLIHNLWRLNVIEHLNLSNYLDLEDHDLQNLIYGDTYHSVQRNRATRRKLKHLRISQCMKTTHRGVSYLIDMVPELETLDISENPLIIDGSVLVKLLSSTPKLKSFACRSNHALADEHLKSISTLPCMKTLEHFSIGRCWHVGDSGALAVLANGSNLKTVELDGTGITDRTILEACYQVMNRGFTRRCRPKIGLKIDCFDCVNLTWACVKQTMLTSLHTLWLDDDHDIHHPTSDHGIFGTKLSRFFKIPRAMHPCQVLKLNCPWRWRRVSNKHTALVVSGERSRAHRLAARWTNLTMAHEGSPQYCTTHALWSSWREVHAKPPALSYALPVPPIFMSQENDTYPEPDAYYEQFVVAILEQSKEYEEDELIYPPGLNLNLTLNGKYWTNIQHGVMYRSVFDFREYLLFAMDYYC
ncbi:hypothetical protein KEM54_000788 [Ascosphaera aggregata]|nr:hypothetical protein KEM54_000788 [Ascosphaera aggregata]